VQEHLPFVLEVVVNVFVLDDLELGAEALVNGLRPLSRT